MATPDRILSPRTVRLWCDIHTWSSLICTLFLLVLCLSGLPLVFHDELDEVLSDVAPAPEMPADTPRISVDRAAEIAHERLPGSVITFIVADRDDPVWRVPMAASADARDFSAVVTIDARTGTVLGVANSYSSPLMAFILRLHTNLFAGQFGSLFLCFIGLSFLAAVLSGVVIYAPFMRKQPFGIVRRHGPRRRWLDLHNLMGIAITLWLLVVGGTGVVNTLARQIAIYWQRTELVEMIAPWRGQPAPSHVVTPQQALNAATTVAPAAMELSSIAMPGNLFAGPHHYTIFFRGRTPLTARILKPVLIDAETGAFTETRELPWYAKALFVSQPLHFGNYGGLPLKIVWGLFDLVAIIILGSGVYLWLTRRESQVEALLGAAANRPSSSSLVQVAGE